MWRAAWVVFVWLCWCGSSWAIPPLPPRTAKVCQPCTKSADCDAGAFCLGASKGTGFCLQPCNGGACPGGFQCEVLAPGIEQCIPTEGGSCFAECSAQKACVTGFDCTQGRCVRKSGGSHGDFCDDNAVCKAPLKCLEDVNKQKRCATPCESPQAGKPRCLPGLACQTVAGQGDFCFPDAGWRPNGSSCSSFDPCGSGLTCRKFSAQSPAQCYTTCMAAGECGSGNGKCDFMTRVGQYCLCQANTDCDNKRTCRMVAGAPLTQGVCRLTTASLCISNDNCPPGYQCRSGDCSDGTTESVTEPTSEPASEPTTEPKNEPQTEPVTPDPGPSEATADEPAGSPDASTSSDEPNGLETILPFDDRTPDLNTGSDGSNTDATGSSDQVTSKKGCGCNGVGPTSSLLWLGLLVLLMVVRRDGRYRG